MKPPIGRLAMRVEGDNWTAYWAKPGTMEGALWLGSIRLALVQSTERREAFIALMRDALEVLFAEKFGPVDSWETTPAPETERSGSA